MNESPQNTTQPQDNHTRSGLQEELPKKKVCILTKILIGCSLGLLITYTMAGYMNFGFISDLLEQVSGLIFFIFFALPFLAIASLIRISLYPDQLRGRIISVILLLLSCFGIFNFAYTMAPRAQSYLYKTWGANLKGLGTALTVYAFENDDVLPSDNWCDLMIEEADVSPKHFICPLSDSEHGEGDFCLNRYVAGKKLSELPDDMVLLFECRFVLTQNQVREPIKNRKDFSNLEVMQDYFKGDELVYLDRWNQVGGPELLAFDRHKDGCNILFADGHTEFVKTDKLIELRWNIENTVHFTLPESVSELERPFFLQQTTILIAILGGVCVIATLYVLIRYKVITYLPFVLFIAVLSTGTGLYFGNMSEEAYNSFIFDGTTGLYSGAFFGLLVGICFPVLLANAPERIQRLRTFKGFAASVGMVVGVICSTLVHLALIIVNKETNFAGILIGIPYGVAAGAVLGLISGFVVNKFYSHKPIETEIKSESIE